MNKKAFWLHLTNRNDPLGITLPDATPDKHTRQGNVEMFPNNSQFIMNATVTHRTPILDYIPLVKEIYSLFDSQSVLAAHSWYWSHPKKFAKFVRKSYTEALDNKTPVIPAPVITPPLPPPALVQQ